MIKTTLFTICSSIETVLSHSYIAVTSALMYGTMWSLGMKFDTRLFTMAYVLLTYTQQSSITYFNFAIRDFFNYMAAEKRIRVGFYEFFVLRVQLKLIILGFSAARGNGKGQSVAIELVHRHHK